MLDEDSTKIFLPELSIQFIAHGCWQLASGHGIDIQLRFFILGLLYLIS